MKLKIAYNDMATTGTVCSSTFRGGREGLSAQDYYTFRNAAQPGVELDRSKFTLRYVPDGKTFSLSKAKIL